MKEFSGKNNRRLFRKKNPSQIFEREQKTPLHMTSIIYKHTKTYPKKNMMSRQLTFPLSLVNLAAVFSFLPYILLSFPPLHPISFRNLESDLQVQFFVAVIYRKVTVKCLFKE